MNNSTKGSQRNAMHVLSIQNSLSGLKSSVWVCGCARFVFMDGGLSEKNGLISKFLERLNATTHTGKLDGSDLESQLLVTMSVVQTTKQR